MSVTSRQVDTLPLREGVDRGGWRAAGLPGAAAAAAVAAFGYVAAVDPNQAGHYPTCPTLALTGFYCPGCGTLRALHALAHGELGVAIGKNVMLVLTLPLLVGLWAAWLRRRVTGRARWVAPSWMIWGLLGVTVLYTIARNLPWFAVLAP